MVGTPICPFLMSGTLVSSLSSTPLSMHPVGGHIHDTTLTRRDVVSFYEVVQELYPYLLIVGKEAVRFFRI